MFQTLAALAALGLLAGAAVVFLGLYNVSARAGHLPGVSWVLHTTYRNAVALRAPPEAEVPDLTDALAALGAKHFDGACRRCHGAPGEIRSATTRAMVPEPPHVTDAVDGWGADELAWILREGVKMSGMPAWPSARDDEVWSTVAFLARVEEMEPARYAELVRRPEMEAVPHLGYCVSCHGADGVSENPHIPRLDILSERYMAYSLEAFRAGERQSGIMGHAATSVPGQALPELAAWFADRGVGPAGEDQPDPALAERGRAIAVAEPGDDVPSCAACHGPWPDRLDDAFPSIAGQYAPYIAAQLRLWRADMRGGGPRQELMRRAAAELTEDDIAALAAFYAALPPAPIGEVRSAGR